MTRVAFVAAALMLSLVLVPLAQAAPLPRCTIVGTQGDDVLVGTAGNDVICGLGGNDVIHGRGGDDTLFGSDGDDVLDGGPGNDTLRGHWGRDRLLGGPGNDLLHGGGNADVLSGGPGVDTADYRTRTAPVRVSIGRGANDGIKGERDNVRGDVENVLGGAGADALVGNGKANRLDGRGGNDKLTGRGGSDLLLGGPGVDRLQGRDGARFRDMLNCGPGGGAAIADARDRVMRNCEHSNQPVVANRAPTDISLSRSTVAEHQPAGVVVGMLGATDRDAGDRHRFRLVGGDEGAFRIQGAELVTAAMFDFKTKSSYSIRVRVTDHDGAEFEKQLTITVTVANEAVVGRAELNNAPTGVTLTPATVDENKPAGTTVGTLAATDADAGQTHSFALATGADNAAFTISGDKLQTTQLFDYEDKSSYSIRVATTDSAGARFAKTLTVTIGDVNEPPVADDRTVTGVAEDGGAEITLSGSDPEGHALTFSIATAPAHGTLGAIGAAGVDYTPDRDFHGTDSFTYTVNDGTATSAPATVSIVVTPVNDAPVAADGNLSTDQDTPATIDLATLVSDVETGNSNLTYTVVSNPAHGQLSANGAARTYTPEPGFSGADSFTYTVTDRGDPDNCGGGACDAPKSSQTKTVSIAVAKTGCITDDSQSDFAAGSPSDCDLTAPGSVQLVTVPDQSNSTLGTLGVQVTTTTWAGQTFTPAHTGELTKVDLNLFCSGCTGATPDLTVSIRATSGGLPTGPDLVSGTIAGFSSGAAEYYTATFASPVTLTAGTQYALLVRPNANAAPGTYALTRSGTNVRGENVYSGGSRLAGMSSGTQWSVPLTGGVSSDAGFRIWLGTAYASSGTLVSSVKDADPPAGATPTWTTLSFDATAPAGTAVKFQVAASNSSTGPFTFVGPDGTPDTFFTASGADLHQFDGFRYLQYKAFLSTSDSSVTPSIQSVRVCFRDAPGAVSTAGSTR